MGVPNPRIISGQTSQNYPLLKQTNAGKQQEEFFNVPSGNDEAESEYTISKEAQMAEEPKEANKEVQEHKNQDSEKTYMTKPFLRLSSDDKARYKRGFLSMTSSAHEVSKKLEDKNKVD